MRNVVIKAERVRARDLLPGELFSSSAPEYWEKMALTHGSCGEKVYVRTNIPADMFGDADELVTRVTIVVSDDDTSPE
jgi:hypothetical protein